jgi:hypothetical protein
MTMAGLNSTSEILGILTGTVRPEQYAMEAAIKHV